MAKTFVLKNESDKKLKVDYKSELNDEQYKVVTSGEGPCLVLAGAGSGKTRTITYRVAYLIEKGIKEENILLVTFTNKAAGEMLKRVSALIGKQPDKLWGGTFHHIGNRILRKYAKLLGYQSNFTILDEGDSKDLLKLCIKEEGVDVKARRFPSAAILKDIISYTKNSEQALEKVIELRHPKWLELENQIQNIAERYKLKKKDNNAMDFDDLLVNWLKLLKDNPRIKDRLAAQFHYILVDEYQDTNYIQAAIIKELASVHHNVLVVGDDAQSIYSFRAADIGNILNFSDSFKGASIFKLEINYRSTPEILKVANEVIKYNVDQYPKILKAKLSNFVKPNVVPAHSAAQEAKFISEQILKLRDEGIKLNKIAVLFRAAYHSQELEFQLTKKDIPYDYRGGVRFFERAHIKDVVAFLKVMTNPKDEAAWHRILQLQVGVGIETAAKIFNRIKDLDCPIKCVEADLSDILSVRAKMGWQNIVNIYLKDIGIKKLKNLNDPASFIRSIAKSDYREYLQAQFPNYQERIEDLEQFAKFAENYEDLNAFLTEITLQEAFAVERATPDNSDEEKLVLSTIHQAKGLEWEVIFVINLVDNAFPNQRALAEDNGLEEERRLFYVAITRAKKQLFLSYPLVSNHSSMYLNTPSQFLQETPDELLEEIKLIEGFSSKSDYNDLNGDGVQYLPEV